MRPITEISGALVVWMLIVWVLSALVDLAASILLLLHR